MDKYERVKWTNAKLHSITVHSSKCKVWAECDQGNWLACTGCKQGDGGGIKVLPMQHIAYLAICSGLHFYTYAQRLTFRVYEYSLISKRYFEAQVWKVEIFVPVMTQWQPWLSLASKPCATFHHSTLAVSAVNIKVTQTYQMWDGGGVHQDFGSDKSITYTWQVCLCVIKS